VDIDLSMGTERYEEGVGFILLRSYGRKLCVSILGWASREVVVPAAPWDEEDTSTPPLWGDEGAGIAHSGGFGAGVVSLLCGRGGASAITGGGIGDDSRAVCPTSCGAVSGACPLLRFEDGGGAGIAALGLDDETAGAWEASGVPSGRRPSCLSAGAEGDEGDEGETTGLLLKHPMGERD
jgi:hypothetical protein